MASVTLENIVVTYPHSRTFDQRRLKSYIERGLSSLVQGKFQKRRQVSALKRISMKFRAGDVAGIIGENGAGKTTLLRVISGVLDPDSGRVDVRGTISSVFNLGAGFIPELSGRENIHLVASLHGFSHDETTSIEQSIIDFSELDEAIDRPLKTYSTGMRSRLGFSIVSFLNTDIIVLDEALAAGDYKFRRKAGNLIDRFSSENKILIVVSHDPGVIREQCNVSYYLHQGEIVAQGDPSEVCDNYESDREKIKEK